MDKEKVEGLRESILNFYSTLHPYDMYALYWLGAVLFFLIILIFIIREKVGLSTFLLIIFMTLLFFGAPISYLKIHHYLYGTKYEIDYIKHMKFANVLVVKGKLTSTGDENITNCNLHSFVMPPQDGFMKNLQVLYAIKPLKRKKITIEENLEKGDNTEFKIKYSNFKYKKDINSSDIYIYRECFNTNIGIE